MEKVKTKNFIQDIIDLDKYLRYIINEYDFPRMKNLFTQSNSVKWIAFDDKYIFKAMTNLTLDRLKASFQLLEVIGLSECFEPYEIVYEGYYISIIKQNFLPPIKEIEENQIINIKNKILQEYPGISFFPKKDVNSCIALFYSDYSNLFYKLNNFVNYFKLTDVFCSINCGTSFDGKIKCFDLEFFNSCTKEDLEKFIKENSKYSNFEIPLFYKLLKE